MKEFEEVYRETALIPVVIFYSPTRERCIVLQHGQETMSFWNLMAAIDYARGMGWLNEAQAHEAREQANDGIFYYDRRQDMIEDQLHISYNKSRAINAAIHGVDPSSAIDDSPGVVQSVAAALKNIFWR